MSDVKYFVGTEEAWKALGKAVQDTYAKRVDNIGDAVTEAAADVKIAADTIVTFDVSSNLNADGSKFEGIATIAGIAGSVVVKEFDQDVTLNCGIKIAQSNVTVDGFDFGVNEGTIPAGNAAAVIYVQGAGIENVAILNNTFDTGDSYETAGAGDIIRVEAAKDLTISHNTILSGTHHGMNLNDLSGICDITDNTLSGLERSGIQFAKGATGTVNVSGNTITLEKDPVSSRVDQDDAAIVFGGDRPYGAGGAQFNVTDNTLTVSGTGMSGDGINGIVFGGETAGVDTQLGNLAIENNTIDFSNGANSVRIDTANTTVDMAKNDLTVNGADATFEEIAGSISNPTPGNNGGVIVSYVDGTGERNNATIGADNPASERSILVDAELFYNRAPGEVVVVDGVTYTVGDNLVGTIEAAFDKFSAGSAAGTILINGEYDGFDFGAVTNTNLISIKALKPGSATINGTFQFDNAFLFNIEGLIFNAAAGEYGMVIGSDCSNSSIKNNIFNGNGLHVITGNVGVFGNTFNGGADTVGIKVDAGADIAAGGSDTAKYPGNVINNGIDAADGTFTNNTISGAEVVLGTELKNNTISGDLTVTGGVPGKDTISGNKITGSVVTDEFADDDARKDFTGANNGAALVDKDIAGEVIVDKQYEGMETGATVIVDGRKGVIGTTVFAGLDDVTGPATILVKDIDAAEVTELGGGNTYAFGQSVKFGDIELTGGATVKGDVEFAGSISGAFTLTIADESKITLGGMIDSEVTINFGADCILAVSGDLFIVGDNANTVLASLLTASQVSGSGTIWVQGLTGGNTVVGDVKVNKVTEDMLADLANGKLETTAGSMIQKLVHGTVGSDVVFDLNKVGNDTSVSDIYAGDIAFNNNDLDVTLSGGKAFLRGSYTGIDHLEITNRGRLYGSLETEAVSFEAVSAEIANEAKGTLVADVETTGDMTVTNSGVISGDYSAASLTFGNTGSMKDVDLTTTAGTLSFTNTGTWTDGSITSTGNVTLFNDGVISGVDIDAAGKDVAFHSAIGTQGNYQEMVVKADSLYLGGANFELVNGSDLARTGGAADHSGMIFFGDKVADTALNQVLSAGFKQELTIADTAVGSVRLGFWQNPAESNADDEAKFILNLKGGTTLAGYANAIDFSNSSPVGSTVPDITVDLEINQNASAAINGNVVNRFGALTSGTGLNVSGNITARDEIAVADDLIATGDITASGAITAGGDLTANIVTIEGEKAVLAVGGDRMDVAQFVLGADAEIKAANVDITEPLNIANKIAGIEAKSVYYTTGDIDDFDNIATTGRIVAVAGSIIAENIEAATGTVSASADITVEKKLSGGRIEAANVEADVITTVKDDALKADGKIEITGNLTVGTSVDAEGAILVGGEIDGTEAAIHSDDYIDVVGVITAKNLSADGADENGFAIDAGNITATESITAVNGKVHSDNNIATGENAVINAQSLIADASMTVGKVTVAEDGTVQAGADIIATEITQAGTVRAMNGKLDVGINRKPVVHDPSTWYFVGGKINAAGEVVADKTIRAGDVTAESVRSYHGDLLIGTMTTEFTGNDIVTTGATVDAAGNLVGGNVEASGSIMVGSIGNAEHYAGAVIAHGTDATDPESGRLHAQGDVFAASVMAEKDLTIDGDVTMYRKDEVNAGNISSRTGKVTIGNVHMAGSITAEGDIEIGDLTEITGALVSNTGAVNVVSLGNVGGNHDALDARQEGFAIWAMDTDQNSGLGFKEGAVINGHIGLGYGADTFSLVNGPTVNGNVYLGGVEDVNAFDTLLVGDDSAFTGDFDLSRSESADAYGNLRIEGGALNLNGGRIFDEDVRETALTLNVGTLSNANVEKIDAVIVEGSEVTLENTRIYDVAESFDEDGNKLADWLGDGALKMNAGTTLNLTGGSIAFFNTADLGGEGSVINVEASRLDINSALDGDFLAEGEAINISNAGKLNLTAATADSEIAGTIAVTGRDSSLSIAGVGTAALTGQISLADNADLFVESTLNVEKDGVIFAGGKSSSAAVSVEAGSILNLNEGSSLALTDGSHLINKGAVNVNGGTVTLQSNGYIRNMGTSTTFNGGQFNIETDALIDGGFVFSTKTTGIKIKDATVTFAAGVLGFGNVTMTGEGNATARIEGVWNGATQTQYAQDVIEIADDFAIDNFAFEAINDSTVVNPPDRETVIEVSAALAMSGNFSVKADVLHVFNTANLTVSLDNDTATDEFLFQIGRYEGFADTPGQLGQRIAITVTQDPAKDIVYSYKLAEKADNLKADYFTVNTPDYKVVEKDGAFYLNYAVSPELNLSVNDQSGAKDDYTYTGSIGTAKQEGFTYSVSCTVGEDVFSVEVDADGNFSVDLVPAAARFGNVTFTATVTDPAGNETSQNMDKLISDVTDPVLGASLDAVVEDRNVTINWDAATDNVAVAGYKLTVGSEVYELAADQVSFTLEGLAYGSYEYTLEAFDAAGNSVAGLAQNFVISLELNLTVSDQSGAMDDYSFTGSVGAMEAGYTYTVGYTVGEDVFSVEVDADGNFSIVLDPVAARFGEFTVNAAITNAAGEIVSSGSVVKAVSDVTNPVLGASLDAAVENRNVTINWDAATDNVAVAGYKLTIGSEVYELAADQVSFTLEGLKVGSYEYTLEAFDAAGNSVAGTTRNFVVESGSSAKQDLDNNNISDIILSHDAGFAGAWLIENDQPAWGNLSTLTGDWKVFGTGMTDAAKPNYDVYLYDAVNNNVGAWVISSVDKGIAVKEYQTIANLNDDTRLLALGDFNGDGETNLLVQSIESGNLGYIKDGAWNEFKADGLGANWSVAGVGDMNGDGIDDLVLHDSQDGNSGVWLLGGEQPVWADLDKLSDSQSILGTGDFNGDGIDDVLIYNSSDRTVGAWLAKDGSISSWMNLGQVEEGASVEGIADFNGDGIADLQIRTDAGDIGALLVNGENDMTWKYYQSVGSEWTSKLA